MRLEIEPRLVEPGKEETFEIWPGLSFEPSVFLVPPDVGRSFLVLWLRVNDIDQVCPGPNGIPADLFNIHPPYWLSRFDTCRPVGRISIKVKNTQKTPSMFTGTVMGEYLERTDSLHTWSR